MDGDRVLKTGGPLEVWRREVVRQGGNVPEALAKGLTPEDIEEAVDLVLVRLCDSYQNWTLADVVENLTWNPELTFDSGFECEWSSRSSFWADASALDIRGEKTCIFHWNTSLGFRVDRLGVLKLCVEEAARYRLRRWATFMVSVDTRRMGDIGNGRALFVIRMDGPARGYLLQGEVAWDQVLNYAAIAEKVDKSIYKWAVEEDLMDGLQEFAEGSNHGQ